MSSRLYTITYKNKNQLIITLTISVLKPTIYQLFIRYFSNTNETRKQHGTLEENGCGKFNDITDEILLSIKAMGFSHVYFTGVIEHATETSFPHTKADDLKIIKGKAGSPFAVKDYFDVSPELAENTEHRIEEFKALVKRAQDQGLKVIIDFIPNHVARSYQSDIKPEIDFGLGDDTSVFFSQNNNFFYLEGEGPLTLPDGVYEPERTIGKVSGNNANTWNPSSDDWYETVKLNYGFNFRNRITREPLEQKPDTWLKMDQVIQYWQKLGVDGFRCDMAHMVPVSFWKWLIGNAREVNPEVYFMGEAYNKDPMKVTDGNILYELQEAGFNTVYDSEAYDLIKAIYEGDKWANDIDQLLWDETRLHKMLKYVENHDEVRTASLNHWGGWGASVGKIAFTLLALISRAPVMLYAGQEVAEPAAGPEGYCSDNGKSSIFDYWSQPELCKKFNQLTHKAQQLDQYQLDLEKDYKKILQMLSLDSIKKGSVYSLNHLNKNNPEFGRLEGEETSGKWIYSFIREYANNKILIVVNLHPTHSFSHINIRYPLKKILGENATSLHEKNIFNLKTMSYKFIQLIEEET